MKKYYLALLFIFTSVLGISHQQERPMLVVIPSYNNENFAKWNISSVISQKYSNYKVVYINDYSSDNTSKIVHAEIAAAHMDDKFIVIDNHKRKGALRNIYEAIYEHAEEEDIVVLLDGDDAFENDTVLAYLNKVYQNPDIWLTYGQFKEKNSGNIGFCSPIPSHIVKKNDFRSWHHIPSHLRTFYAWLFKEIKTEDLMYEGDFFKMTWDMAIMLPMIEMTGGRFRFIPKVLYHYNDNNPISDHRVDRDLQRGLDLFIRTKQKYKPLDKSPIETSYEVLKEENFLIIIASYNNQRYCVNNLKSVLEQDYPSYQVVYIDDCSSDKTDATVLDYLNSVGKRDKVTFIRNNERRGAAYNYYNAIHQYAKNDDVVVILDGDDELAHSQVLRKLNSVYHSPLKDVWLTYGQFKEKTSNSVGFCREYPKNIMDSNSYRDFQDIPSHLKTFKAWLFKKIKKEDFFYKGRFMPMTWDMAAMLPMMEMAGEHHHSFIPEVLYIYNDVNPNSDHRVGRNLQREIDHYLRKKPRYQKLRE